MEGQKEAKFVEVSVATKLNIFRWFGRIARNMAKFGL